MPNPYIAKEKLFVGTALAHNVGDVVPDENVKANGWEDSVSRAGSKSADEALKAAKADTEPAATSEQGPAPK